MLTANEVVQAFHTNCPKKHWKARTSTVLREGGPVEQVHFADRSGLISLMYDVQTGEYRRFQVSFEKALASWGDYVAAISKGLHTVLSALQAGGLPFVAPDSLDDIAVTTRYAGAGGLVTAEVAPAKLPVPQMATDELL